ncbi:hypothetical protein [Dactylosporangium sp. NPDC051484]|uniref:hypothetical protein n=1 Tax=Dactylosporangium sp. NPDC051484 TaxID=3154942 RepID=UPI0034511134
MVSWFRFRDRLALRRDARGTILTARLPSILPGSTFTARIYAEWFASKATVPDHLVEPFVGHHLRLCASEVARGYSVLDCGAALDALRLRITQIRLSDELGSVDVASTVELRTDDQSVALAGTQLRRKFELMLQHDHVRESVRFLHGEVFSEANRARMWWLLQSPEFLKAIDFAAFLDSMAAAKAANSAATQKPDEVTALVVEVMHTIRSDERRLELGLDVLSRLLSSFGLEAEQEKLGRLRARQATEAREV